MLTKNCNYCGKEYQTYFKDQKCCSRECNINNRPYKSTRDNITLVACEFQIVSRCKKNYSMSERAKLNAQKRNNGKVICMYCSRHLKSMGRANPNTKYKNMNDNYFKKIDSNFKAYLLGWIGSDGHISKSGTVLQIHEKDKEILVKLRDGFCKDLPIHYYKEKEQVALIISSKTISDDLCELFSINPGKKSAPIQFPNIEEQYYLPFIRGYFDGDGCVISPDSKSNSPTASIHSNSSNMLNVINQIIGIPCSISSNTISWNGNNALDFLSKIYDNSEIYLDRKKNLYHLWSTWVVGLSGTGCSEVTPFCKFQRTRKGAVIPSKSNASDSGYDLTIIEEVKSFGEKTKLYTTGIKVLADFGWYFDIAPRSSIIKTGYILSNSIGVIDRTYRGEVMVSLTKIDDSLPDIELPLKIAQLIPRPIVHMNFVEVESFDECTKRNEGGFGSTGI